MICLELIYEFKCLVLMIAYNQLSGMLFITWN